MEFTKDDINKPLYTLTIGEFLQLNRRSVLSVIAEQLSKLKPAKESEGDEWLSTEEAKRLLGIKSKSKLQQLRDNDDLVYSKHGRIIKYSKSSIMAFLARNVIRHP
jgi:hypothetical protein